MGKKQNKIKATSADEVTADEVLTYPIRLSLCGLL